jgi:hypothetical protein
VQFSEKVTLRWRLSLLAAAAAAVAATPSSGSSKFVGEAAQSAFVFKSVLLVMLKTGQGAAAKGWS